MDGAANIPCGQCGNTTQPQFRYVDNSSGILNPYLTLATQYGFANYMFQTNQGASFSAHQYIFGATSAPTAEDDASGTFAAENPEPMLGLKGCIGDSDQTIQLIDAYGVEDPNNVIYPCFEHQTVVDLLDPINISWRYYAANTGGIWSAPDAIKHICQPSNGKCTGADFLNNVDPNPADVLRDVGNCQLRNLTWVTPTGQNSDHSLLNNGGGPSWVASIVNAIGTSACKNSDGSSYWNSTAIIIAWDDWGGWYDHVPPPILAFPQGGYQFGFRVPMIVVSAYTPQGFIGDKREDFGSIVRFMEYNFGIAQGALNFADARADTNLKEYFNFHMTPRLFQKIPARRDAKYFLNDKSTMLPADDD